MEDGCPDSSPTDKLRIYGNIVDLDDIVNGIIKQRDETGDADYGKRLDSEDAEYHGGEGGTEQSFVDTKEPSCTAVHIKCKGESW